MDKSKRMADSTSGAALTLWVVEDVWGGDKDC